MKRLIKYHSPYNEIQFSDCSTKYTVLPYLVDDLAGEAELLKLAADLGFKNNGKAEVLPESHRNLTITHSLELSESIDNANARDDRRKVLSVRLGFVRLYDNTWDSKILPLNLEPNKKITQDQVNEIVNNQAFGVQNTCTLDNEQAIVIQDWSYFHEMIMRGYDLKSFEAACGVEDGSGEVYFDDSVSSCSGCGEYDHNDDGYKNNFRVIGCELFGIGCGCYKEAAKDNLEEYIDNDDKCIDKEVVEDLIKEKKVKFVQRFVGGMTDSNRYHSYGGESVEIGAPAEILKKFKAKYPKKKYIFCHDESGQFQTYFSLYQVK